MYEPQIDDYVVWERPNGDTDEGWVYFKGEPEDNEKRKKQGWNPLSQYITIEIHVYPKKECTYTSGKPMRHKNIHCLLICNRENWNQLRCIKNRRDDSNEERLIEMYHAQRGRYEDTQ